VTLSIPTNLEHSPQCPVVLPRPCAAVVQACPSGDYLRAVVEHYERPFTPGLNDHEKGELIEYLKSL
jgi:hypothetical protein